MRDEKEKNQMENLQRWFALCVEFPWLEPVMRVLVKAPRNPLIDTRYWWVHKLWKGWAITRRIHPIKITPKVIWNNAKHFMQMEAWS